MKKVLFLFFLIFSVTMAQVYNLHNIFNDYLNYKEKSLDNMRIKHKEIETLITQVKKNKLFTVDSIGFSTQKRSIYLIKYGTGSKKVFMWSQMHGDEPTATMAIFDLLNFFASSDQNDSLRKYIHDNLTLYFIPMLNPDGAEVFTRRTAFNIDMNRDYLNPQTPEAKLLRSVFNNLRPDFGFNLHDQNRYYAAGLSEQNSAISFLAPAPDYQKSISPNRKNAMQVIGMMFKQLEDIIPGHIAKYNDDFEPRAFGDNFQKEGMATILIESGYWMNDVEKQFLRKLNFLALLTAFNVIADGTYNHLDTETYNNIPFNKEIFKDVILRNVLIKKGKDTIVTDVSIKREDRLGKDLKTVYYVSTIEDIGDLKGCYAHEEYDFTGLYIEPGKVYHKAIRHTDSLNVDLDELYEKGILYIPYKKAADEPFTKLPINFGSKSLSLLKVDAPADFIVKDKDEILYIFINGFFYDFHNKLGTVCNGRID